MTLCMCFIDQPLLMNSAASQFKRDSFEHSIPALPKSLGVATRPRPKWNCQIRLIITRDVSGCCELVIHLANASRRPVVNGFGDFGIFGLLLANIFRNSGSTFLLGRPALPRISR